MAKRLITAEEVMDIALPRTAIDKNLLKEKRIEAGELKHLQEVIGSDFYDELVDQNNTETLTSDNAAVLDPHIKDVLAFYVMLEAVPFMFVDMSDAGIQRQNTEFTDAATREEKADLMSQLRGDADIYKAKLIKFLDDAQDGDSSKYPLYEASKNVNEKVEVIGGIMFDVDDKPVEPDAGIDKGRSLRDC